MLQAVTEGAELCLERSVKQMTRKLFRSSNLNSTLPAVCRVGRSTDQSHVLHLRHHHDSGFDVEEISNKPIGLTVALITSPVEELGRGLTVQNQRS
jgi:hypothetical protein